MPQKRETLRELLDALPETLRRQVFTHASWVEHRAESYERLAFLGDVVLSLAVSTHLFPRFERHGAGRLTKVGRRRSAARRAPGWHTSWACPMRCATRRPTAAPAAARSTLVESERVLASVCEAIIGAAYLEFGFERTGAGGRRVVRRGDRRGAGAPRGLQVGAPGAAGTARRAGGLPHRRRAGPGARAQLRRGGRGAPGRSSAAGRERRRRARSRRPRSTRSTPSKKGPAG